MNKDFFLFQLLCEKTICPHHVHLALSSPFPVSLFVRSRPCSPSTVFSLQKMSEWVIVRLLKRHAFPHERWKSSECQRFHSIWNDRLTLFVHLSFKSVEHEKGSFYPGVRIKGRMSGKVKLTTGFCLRYQRAFSSLLSCVCGGGLVWNLFRLRRFPSQPFHLDVLETNNCFIATFRKCGFHITTWQTPTGQQNKGRFFRINASSDVLQMPVSRSASRLVSR